MKATPIPTLSGEYAADAPKIARSFELLYDTIETVAGNLDGKIDAVAEDVGTLKADVATLKENVLGINGKLSSLEGKMDTFLEIAEQQSANIYTLLRELIGQNKTSTKTTQLGGISLVREEPPTPE